MSKIIIKTAKTFNGYCGSCDLLLGWVVACSGSFDDFKKEVVDSIQFEMYCAEKEGIEINPIFYSNYEIEYEFI